MKYGIWKNWLYFQPTLASQGRIQVSQLLIQLLLNTFEGYWMLICIILYFQLLSSVRFRQDISFEELGRFKLSRYPLFFLQIDRLVSEEILKWRNHSLSAELWIFLPCLSRLLVWNERFGFSQFTFELYIIWYLF